MTVSKTVQPDENHPTNPIPSPLSDVTILDLTVALAGPVATLLLGGLGARVIKIENPIDGDPCRCNPPYIGVDGVSLTRRRPDDVSLSAVNRLRNKLGVTLNLKNPQSRAILADLVRKADVLVENFSPGTLDRLGAGYESVRAINPRIVYCSITGFGADAGAGPTKALDTTIQALSGIMNVSGEEGEPPVRIGVPIADISVALFGVIGVLAALHQARRSGIGQQVDVSMLGSLTSLVASEPYDAMEQCGAAVRTGQTFQRLAPFGVFRASDGYVAICAYTDAFAHSLFRVMGREDLIHNDRFRTRDTRVQNFREVDAEITKWTMSLPAADVVAKVHAVGIPVSQVRDPKTAMRDPRVVARHDTVPLLHPQYGRVGDVYGMGLPIKFSAASAEFEPSPPALGQHNQAVYADMLGYTTEQLEQLRRDGVI